MMFNILLILSILILYIIINLFEKSKKKSNDLFLSITFLILFLLVAFRTENIGNDTKTYLNFFNKTCAVKWSLLEGDSHFEKGYIILNILISYISSNSRFFMIFMSLIFNFVVFYFIKKNSKNYLLSVLIYICMLHFYNSMTMMRQFCAIIVLLSAFKFVKEKSVVWYIISVVLASLFHSTAWLGLLIYVAYNCRYTNKRAIIILIIAIICTMFVTPLMDVIAEWVGRNNFYNERQDGQSLANMLYAIVYFVMYIFSIYEITKSKNHNTNKNYFNLYCILGAVAINLIGLKMNVLSRAALYFDIFIIIILPNVIEENITNIYNKKRIYLLVVVFLLLYSSTIMYFRPEWNSAFNYQMMPLNEIINLKFW